jgi:hypothetical protein
VLSLFVRGECLSLRFLVCWGSVLVGWVLGVVRKGERGKRQFLGRNSEIRNRFGIERAVRNYRAQSAPECLLSFTKSRDGGIITPSNYSSFLSPSVFPS